MASFALINENSICGIEDWVRSMEAKKKLFLPPTPYKSKNIFFLMFFACNKKG
jgi:hypothetical protein